MERAPLPFPRRAQAKYKPRGLNKDERTQGDGGPSPCVKHHHVSVVRVLPSARVDHRGTQECFSINRLE